jgi:hypothetical protein
MLTTSFGELDPNFHNEVAYNKIFGDIDTQTKTDARLFQ